MDMSIAEKFRDNFLAFLFGAIASGSIVWTAVDNLHKKEIAIIEREKAELQRHLDETDARLKANKDRVKFEAKLPSVAP